jgi:small GTP-binding protein
MSNNSKKKDKEKFKVKVVLIGEAGVGKTCLISRYVSDSFDEHSKTTDGASYVAKTIYSEEYDCFLQFDIWDTAGQEKFRSISKFFYRDAAIILFVYDITNKDSFDAYENYWRNEIKVHGDKNVILAIVGNKSDLYENEKVTDEQAKEYAYSINSNCYLTSARNNVGIKNMFEELGNLYLEPTFQEKRNKEINERNCENNENKKNIVIIQKDNNGNNNKNENENNDNNKNNKKKKNCC